MVVLQTSGIEIGVGYFGIGSYWQQRQYERYKEIGFVNTLPSSLSHLFCSVTVTSRTVTPLSAPLSQCV